MDGSVLEVNHKQLTQVIKACYATKLPLFIWGAIGIGKSQKVRDVSVDLGISMVDVRISQLDPSDLRGLPKYDGDTTRWLPPNWLPKDKDSKGILFLDELNLAPPSIQASCFKGDTIVAGEQYKKIEELKVGDKVIDKNGNLKSVYDLKQRDYNGPMYSIKGRGFLPVEATGEHPFLTIGSYTKRNEQHKKKGKFGDVQWTIAKDLKEGMYIGIPKLKPTRDDKVLSLYTKGQKQSTLQLTYDLARFLGYYVGDGYSSNGRIGICLNKSEIEYQKDVTALFERIFGRRPGIKKCKGNCIDIGLGDHDIESLLKKICGKDTYEKKIPTEILFNKDIKLLNEFLIGYFRADGHVYNEKDKKTFVGMTTVNKVLAMQLQQAFTRFGLLVCIWIQKAGQHVIQGKTVNCRESYRIQSSQKTAFDIVGLTKNNIPARKTEHFFESGGILWAKIDKIDYKTYEGKVYNCEVEDTHSYLANNYIVHNCYQLVLDRKIGDYKLPDGWSVIAAGNRIEDRCNVFAMAGALRNRLCQVVLKMPGVDEWIDWAAEHKVNPDIIAFLSWKSDYLHTFDKNPDASVFATHRGWGDFVNKLLLNVEKGTDEQLVIGCAVGSGISREFLAFRKLHKKLDLNQILKNPKMVANIKEPDIKYCLVSALSSKYTQDSKNLKDVLAVTIEMDAEFGILLGRLMKLGNKSFGTEVQQLIRKKDTVAKGFIEKYWKYLTDEDIKESA